MFALQRRCRIARLVQRSPPAIKLERPRTSRAVPGHPKDSHPGQGRNAVNCGSHGSRALPTGRRPCPVNWRSRHAGHHESFRSTASSRAGRSKTSAMSAIVIVIDTRTPSVQLGSYPDAANTRKPATRIAVVAHNAGPTVRNVSRTASGGGRPCRRPLRYFETK